MSLRRRTNPRATCCFRLAWVALAWPFLLCPGSRSQTGNPEQQFQAAVAAQQRGDGPAALRIYQSLLRNYPKQLALRVNLAGLLIDAGRFDEAIQQYRAALVLEPGNQDVRLGLDLAYLDKGDQASLVHAIRDLQAFHLAHQDNDQAAMLLGDAYSRRQRYAEAAAILSPLEAAHSEDNDLRWLLGAALIRSGHPGEGLGRVEAAAAQTGAAEAYLLAGQTRLGLSQYDLALQDAQAAIAKDPSQPGAQTLLGMVLEHLGTYDQAEVALRKALELNPEDYDAQFYLGALLLFHRDIPGAEQHLAAALRLRPNSVEARYKQAVIEQTKGDLEAASRDLETVTRQSPDWLEPHAKLAAIYYSLHRPEEGMRERASVDRLTARKQTQPAETR